MRVVKTETIKVCDRCGFGKEKPAETHRKYSVEGAFYEIDLCELHAVQFDRELGFWTRLSRDDEFPNRVRVPKGSAFITAEARERDRRAAELRELAHQADAEVAAEALRQQEASREAAKRVTLQPPSVGHDWVISTHARERMELRGFSEAEVLAAAAHPEFVINGDREARKNPGTEARIRGGCKVVVNPSQRVIITVKYKVSEQLAHSAPERIAQ